MFANRLAAVCIVAMALCVFAAAPSPASAQEKKPNVLLILADDLGYADVGFNGRKEWTTENLDRLASEGTIFHRWYTASVVCAPSRAALMTGRYGIHNGVTGNGSLDLPAEELTIAEALRAHGYKTGLFGKWHHGPPRPGAKAYTHPMDQGFDEFYGFTSAVDAWQKFPKQLFDGRKEKPTNGGFADTLFTDHAIDFVKRHKDEPFFCYLPVTTSHGLQEAPEEDIARFKGKFPEKDPAKPIRATYAAMVYRMDQNMGRLMKALDDLKLRENTLVIFSSDHGATFEKMQQGATNFFDSNRPFRGQKRTLWEGGVRVPGVVRWPAGKVPAGKTSEEVINMVDLFPTILAATGAEPPSSEKKIDGVNVLDVWRGGAKSPQRTLFWEWREGGDTQLAAMRGDLKVVINSGNNPEIYDVVADPGERRTLHAEFQQEMKSMVAELNAWIATETDAAKMRKKKADGTASE